MRDRLTPPIPSRMRLNMVALRAVCAAGAIYALCALLIGLAAPTAARAQEPPAPLPPIVTRRPIGTLRIEVYNGLDNTPIANIGIRTDSEEERPRYGLTGPNGVAEIRLFAGTYNVFLNGSVAGFETRQGVTTKGQITGVTVVEGQVTVRRVYLDERIIDENIRRRLELINRNETGVVTRRVRSDFFDYPLGAGDRQSLGKLLRSVPGFVFDAEDQIHPRGENAVNTVTYIDGVMIPAIPAGTLVPFIIPDTLDAFNARVGGLSAQYGGGSGAVLELETRQPRPRKGYLEFGYRGGDYDTDEFYGNIGGSLPRVGKSNGFIKGMDYAITLSQRYTRQGTEAPQDTLSGGANYKASELFYSKLNFDLGKNRRGQNLKLSALFNFSSGRTGIASRTGLRGQFAPYGAGFGYLGAFNNRDGLLSQDELGQDFRQKDNNSLTLIQLKSSEPDPSDFNKQRTVDRAVFSVGVTSSTRFVGDQGGTPKVSLTRLPANSSIEYLPTTLNDYQQILAQIDITPRPFGRGDAHQLKYGLVFHDINGQDSLQLIPQSQLAADQLFQLDPRLTPAGSVIPGSNDALGNPVYRLSSNPESPILFNRKDGYYAAAYIQDFYKITSNFRVNFGLRVDRYSQTVKSTSTLDGVERSLPDSSGTTLSPRINMVLKLPERGRFHFLDFITQSPTLVRGSYNRLFTPPHLNQGVFLYAQPGNNIYDPNVQARLADVALPQITDQYDLSVERQMGINGILKIGAYTKNIKNTLTTRQTLPALQSGLLSVYNVGKTTVNGLEVSYQILPPPAGESGLHGFLSYANSSSSADEDNPVANTGESVVNGFSEYDQANTLSAGLAYSFRSGASAGLSLYYGDGLYSSKTALLFVPIRSGDRQNITEVNLRVATPPTWINQRLGAEIQVENLFDSRGRMEWRGPYGTRYQLGRRIYFTITGRL